VLGLAIARELYDRFPDFPEGRLAKLRAHVVSRQSCAVVGRRLDLASRLAAAAPDIPADEVDRLATGRNVVPALVEAALGALYVEHGFEPIQPAIVAAFQDRIEYALTVHVDYKTELQEALARLGQRVSYSLLSVDGPPHERRFTAAATIDGDQVGVGAGSSKKAAEQEAAREALAKVRSL
jgi:ribonuclease-3